MKMNSQAYVSGPSLCDTFYKNMANKKFNPYKLRKNKIRQIGRGLHGQFKGSYIITVNPSVVKEEGKKTIPTTLVTDPCCCCRGKSSFRIQRRKEKTKTPQ
jgi:hypothetical protein